MHSGYGFRHTNISTCRRLDIRALEHWNIWAFGHTRHCGIGGHLHARAFRHAGVGAFGLGMQRLADFTVRDMGRGFFTILLKLKHHYALNATRQQAITQCKSDNHMHAALFILVLYSLAPYVEALR